MTPNGNIDLDQHWLGQWLGAWWHQAIIWINVDLSLVGFRGIHQKTISQWVLKLLFCKMSLKIKLLKLLPHFTVTNDELNIQDPNLVMTVPTDHPEYNTGKPPAESWQYSETYFQFQCSFWWHYRLYSNISQILLLYKTWGITTNLT